MGCAPKKWSHFLHIPVTYCLLFKIQACLANRWDGGRAGCRCGVGGGVGASLEGKNYLAEMVNFQ